MADDKPKKRQPGVPSSGFIGPQQPVSEIRLGYGISNQAYTPHQKRNFYPYDRQPQPVKLQMETEAERREAIVRTKAQKAKDKAKEIVDRDEELRNRTIRQNTNRAKADIDISRGPAKQVESFDEGLGQTLSGTFGEDSDMARAARSAGSVTVEQPSSLEERPADIRRRLQLKGKGSVYPDFREAK